MPDTQQPTPSKPPKRDPAFPLYADDFLSGTAEMSAEEVGAYIRLLCHQWAKGGLPNDEPRLARMAGLIGSPSLGYVVAKFAPCPDGYLRHPRLEAIRAEREAFKARQANSGAVGAERRWGKKPKNGDPNGDPNGKPMATPMANAWPEDGSPSPSPSPITEPTPTPSEPTIPPEPPSPWIVDFGLELPESLRTQNCLNAIRTWLDYKRERKQGYKPQGLKGALTAFSKQFTPATFPSAVERSIANNWSGLFPETPKPNGKPAPKPIDATMSDEEKTRLFRLGLLQ